MDTPHDPKQATELPLASFIACEKCNTLLVGTDAGLDHLEMRPANATVSWREATRRSCCYCGEWVDDECALREHWSECPERFRGTRTECPRCGGSFSQAAYSTHESIEKFNEQVDGAVGLSSRGVCLSSMAAYSNDHLIYQGAENI